MSKIKKFKTWYKVLVQFETFRHCFEVCEVDVLAACKAVKKLIAESEDCVESYCIEECIKI